MHPSVGTQSTSPGPAPRLPHIGRMVERQHARPRGFVVTRPLGRLSMTFWFRAGRALETDASLSHALGHRPAPPRRIRRGSVPPSQGRVAWAGAAPPPRPLSHRPGTTGGGEGPRQHDADVQHGAERGHQEPAAAELDDAGRDDWQGIERREEGGDAAGQEGRHDDGIASKLRVHQPPETVDLTEAWRPRRLSGLYVIAISQVTRPTASSGRGDSAPPSPLPAAGCRLDRPNGDKPADSSRTSVSIP